MNAPTRAPGNTSIVVAILIAGLLVAAALLYSKGAFRFNSSEEDPIQVEMQNAVLAELTDPGSAEFRNVRKSTIGYCGEVNAKNRMGGYVGFKAFTTYKDSQTGMWKTTYDPQLVGVMCP